MRLIDADALIPIMKYNTTDNEIGVFPIRIGFNTIKRVIDEAPTAQPEKTQHYQEGTTSDLISRQAAIDALDKRFDDVPMELTTEILQLRRDLRELPSAQPEPLTDKEEEK